MLAELTPRVLELAQLAKRYGIGFTIDAEEADRLELSLDVIGAALRRRLARRLGGLRPRRAGLPEARAVRDRLARRPGAPHRPPHSGAPGQGRVLGQRGQARAGRRPVRLSGVHAQAQHRRVVPGHARRMLDAGDALYPMFATHNAHTIAAIHELAKGRAFEFQKLHGMGDDLYAEVIPRDRLDVPCRVYAPVGSHEDLLPYLVRRLLENGANSSFVNRITDEDVAIDDLIRDPVETVAAFEIDPASPHPAAGRPVPQPGDPGLPQ